MAGLLAGEMGVNVTMARRAGLLHDIGKALDHEIEGSHVQIGVDICRKYKENTQIIHAIEAHHGDVEDVYKRQTYKLDTTTGVDLIIDDTPEAITLSSFDQTRREVARMTLELSLIHI